MPTLDASRDDLPRSAISLRLPKGMRFSDSWLGFGLGGGNGVEAPLLMPALPTPLPMPGNNRENSFLMLGSVEGPLV